MKTEKELEEEIEKLKPIMEREHTFIDDEDKKIDLARYKFYKLELQLKTLQERNAEVKQAIEELDWSQIEFEAEKGLDGCDTGHYHPNKKELLQKLGLGK